MKMKNKRYYKVKTQKGYVLWTLTVYAFGVNGSNKIEYKYINTPDLADSFNYEDACNVAFELNQQYNAIDFAVIEDEETV